MKRAFLHLNAHTSGFILCMPKRNRLKFLTFLTSIFNWLAMHTEYFGTFYTLDTHQMRFQMGQFMLFQGSALQRCFAFVTILIFLRNHFWVTLMANYRPTHWWCGISSAHLLSISWCWCQFLILMIRSSCFKYRPTEILARSGMHGVTLPKIKTDGLFIDG